MLACIPRQQSQNLSSQRLVCNPKILDLPLAVPTTLATPTMPPQQQTNASKHALVSMETPRYPSPAELDAFAQKTLRSPLSIRIFPSSVRVPQCKQVNRTVNGLDTTGQQQRYGNVNPYPQPYTTAGYRQGLLAIVAATVLVRGGVVKSSEGKRTRHPSAAQTPAQTAAAPYAPRPAGRHGHKAYRTSSCRPPDSTPFHVLVATTAAPSIGGQTLTPQALPPPPQALPLPPQALPLPPRAGLGDVVQGLRRQMARRPHGQTLPQQRGGGAQASPSLQAVAAVACLDSGLGTTGAGPQSSVAYSAAVLPTQSADVAKATGYRDTTDYGLWTQQQQHSQQGALRMYNSRGPSVVSRSPETCQLSYRPHALSASGGGARPEQVSSSPLTCAPMVSSSPLTCAPMHGEFSVGQYFAPPWNSVLATPDSDCYPGDMGLSHPHPNPQAHHLPQHPHPQAYSAEQSLGMACCGLPSARLCHAAVLSSSLQSLEVLISGVHPPCIKERMLGRGYDALGGAGGLLDYHHLHNHHHHHNLQQDLQQNFQQNNHNLHQNLQQNLQQNQNFQQQQQQHSGHIQLPVFR